MFMAIMMFGDKGADIVYPDPGFPIYRSMIEFAGARPIPLPMREVERLRLLGRGGAEADDARDAARSFSIRPPTRPAA